MLAFNPVDQRFLVRLIYQPWEVIIGLFLEQCG